MKLLMNLWNDQSGQDLTEYALLLVLISLVAIASMKTIAAAISTVFTTAAADLSVGT
ncbi:MAG TPA: Flp family type IVb pilin [Candidatus Acidoferrales bacterium]|jgi:Flp pilus assembly pilin Flp|nr:Flp family type IVb pilin [Candidatus Acidoferrales bacterium]